MGRMKVNPPSSAILLTADNVDCGRGTCIQSDWVNDSSVDKISEQQETAAGKSSCFIVFFTLFESQSGKILRGLLKQREEWQGLRKTNRDALLSALRQGRMNR